MIEIPAGTKVKVNGQSGEVLAHMDGVVHVNIDGEVVSVDPSQVMTGDASPAAPSAEEGGIGSDPTDEVKKLSEIPAEVITALDRQIALMNKIPDLESRIATLETRVLAMDAEFARFDGLMAGLSIQPKPIDAAESAAQTQPNDEASNAAAESGEPASGSEA